MTHLQFARRVLARWHEHVAQRAYKTARAAAASRHAARSRLARGLRGLRMAVAARHTRRVQVVHAAAHARRSAMTRAWAAWRVALVRAHGKRCQAMRVRTRMARFKLRLAWRGWTAEVARCQTKQAVGAWATRQLCLWRQGAVLVAWCAWSRARRQRRLRMQRVASAHWARQLVRRAWEVWRWVVARRRAQQRKIRVCWRARDRWLLAAAFYGLLGRVQHSHTAALEERVSELTRELQAAVAWSD